jgi:hypothetical protein
MSRIQLWRIQMMASIPEELLERLFDLRHAKGTGVSSKQLAAVGAALSGKPQKQETECCPQCGSLLRIRGISPEIVGVVNAWLEEQDLEVAA